MAVLLAIVLMEQQVDRRFAEGGVVRRFVVAPHGGGVDAERPLGAAQKALGERQPSLHQILLHDDSVVPRVVPIPCVVCGVDELAVHHGPRKHLTQVAPPAENQDRSPGGREAAVFAALPYEAPLVQEFHVREHLARGSALVLEHAPIPAQRIGIEHLLEIKVQQLADTAADGVDRRLMRRNGRPTPAGVPFARAVARVTSTVPSPQPPHTRSSSPRTCPPPRGFPASAWRPRPVPAGSRRTHAD